MTAQEAQTTLGIETPFSTVELKSAHKNALVTWFPAQFMSDRSKLSQALEQTARIHEAYEMLLPMCQEEERKNANPWLDEALKQAYGQTPSGASAPAPSAFQEATPDRSPSDESSSPASSEPLPLEESSRASRDVFAAWEKEATVAFVPAPPRTSGKDSNREPVAKTQPPLGTEVSTSDKEAGPVTAGSGQPAETPATPAPAPANPFLHDIVPLKKAAEAPKVELRGNVAAQVGQATSSPSTPSQEGGPDSGSTVAPRADTAITKVRPPKVVISPRLQGASVRPAMPVVTVPVPLPPLAAPAPVSGAPLPPAAKAAPIPPAPIPVAEAPSAPSAPVPAAEAPEAIPTPSPVAETLPAPAVPASVVEAPPTPPASVPVAETPAAPVAADIPPAASPTPVAEAAPTPASIPVPEPAHAAPVSATVAEEASAVEQASHHVHAAATQAVDHASVPAAIPVPKAKPKPKPATGKGTEKNADNESDEEPAGDHALVPALGDRYHPAEKEGSPNTDTSRHFPTRPVAPSQAGDESEDTASAADDNAGGAAVGTGRVRLNIWQRFYRFVLGGVSVVAVGYGIYWLSQSNIGRDPWGFEPGSGGPSDRLRHIAFESLVRSAENGNVGAQLKVARAYQKGELVEANSAQALKWFRMAAENGSADAQYAVGDAYKTGSGVPQDNAEALKWYRMAEATREGQRTEKPEEKEEDVRLR